MTTTELIRKVRFEINDNDDTNGYRFSRLDLELFIPDAVREIYRKRPDVRMNSRFEMEVFEDLYSYDCDEFFIEGFTDIFGWDKELYPTITFHAVSNNNVVARDGNVDLFRFSYERPFVYAQIINEVTNGEFGGVVYPVADILSGISYDVTARERNIPVDFFIERALVFYLAYSAFSIDNEDEYNGNRATEYLAKFFGELGVSHG